MNLIRKKNSVLILGKSGQVAKSLFKYKLKANFKLTFLDRNQINLDSNFYEKLNNYIIKENPKFLINTAAYTAVDKAEKDIDKAMNINGYAVGEIAKLSSELKIPLFHYSTDYVFGDNSSNYLIPEYEKKPYSAYGQSKLLGEKLINDFVQSKKLKVIILRISWVFSDNKNNFVNTILNLSENKDELKVVNDQFGGPTSSDSIALATIQIINEYFDKASTDDKKDFPWGVYHFQGSPIVSWFQFAVKIVTEAEKLGLIKRKPKINDIKTNQYNSNTKRPLNSRLSMKSSNTKLNLVSPSWEKDLINCLKNIKNSKAKV